MTEPRYGSYGPPDVTLTVQRTETGAPQAIYVYLPNHPRLDACVLATVQAGHDVQLDLDADGRLIGVEILV